MTDPTQAPTVEVATSPTQTTVTVTVTAHEQKVTHSYSVHFPDHAARAHDPHYTAFESLRRALEKTPQWQCAIGAELSDFSACDTAHPLELHHSIVEFAVANEVDLTAIGHDFPEIKTEDDLQAFLESGRNVQVLCQFHHRGHGGIHVASYADYEAEKYVKGLIT